MKKILIGLTLLLSISSIVKASDEINAVNVIFSGCSAKKSIIGESAFNEDPSPYFAEDFGESVYCFQRAKKQLGNKKLTRLLTGCDSGMGPKAMFDCNYMRMRFTDLEISLNDINVGALVIKMCGPGSVKHSANCYKSALGQLPEFKYILDSCFGEYPADETNSCVKNSLAF